MASVALAESERAALYDILERAARSPSEIAVVPDLYDFFWRGAASHAHAHGRPDRAQQLERATRDTRDEVAIEGGHVVALRLTRAKIDDLSLLARIDHLVALDLHDDAVEHMGSLPALPDLDHLDLSGNRLGKIEPISAPGLHSLYLADNHIARVEALEGLPRLEVLNLSGNAVSKMEGFSAAPSLRALSLSRNPVKRIEGLEGNREIVDLDLSYCEIAAIENIEPLQKLVYLNLWHNHIVLLEGVEAVPNLLYLGVGENPFAWHDPRNEQIMKTYVASGRLFTAI